MKCYSCDKLKESYEANKTTCGSCREVLKIDIVNLLLEKDPVYLSESNRNKTGRPSKLTADQKNDIRYEYRHGKSMGKLAKKNKVSKSTISSIIHAPVKIPGGKPKV